MHKMVPDLLVGHVWRQVLAPLPVHGKVKAGAAAQLHGHCSTQAEDYSVLVKHVDVCFPICNLDGTECLFHDLLHSILDLVLQSTASDPRHRASAAAHIRLRASKVACHD